MIWDKKNIQRDSAILQSVTSSCTTCIESERVQVCVGQTFEDSFCCSDDTGTRSLNSGCPHASNYLPSEYLGNSECGTNCGY